MARQSESPRKTIRPVKRGEGWWMRQHGIPLLAWFAALLFCLHLFAPFNIIIVYRRCAHICWQSFEFKLQMLGLQCHLFRLQCRKKRLQCYRMVNLCIYNLQVRLDDFKAGLRCGRFTVPGWISHIPQSNHVAPLPSMPKVGEKPPEK